MVVLVFCVVLYLLSLLIYRRSRRLLLDSLMDIIGLLELFDVTDEYDKLIVDELLKYWKIRVSFNITHFGKYLRKNNTELFNQVGVIFRKL